MTRRCPVCGNREIVKRADLYIAHCKKDMYFGTDDYGCYLEDDQFYICRSQDNGCGAIFYKDKVIRRGWDYLIPIFPENE